VKTPRKTSVLSNSPAGKVTARETKKKKAKKKQRDPPSKEQGRRKTSGKEDKSEGTGQAINEKRRQKDIEIKRPASRKENKGGGG